MVDDGRGWHGCRGPRRSRRGQRRRRGWEPPEGEPRELTAEERAERKVQLAGEAIRFAFVSLLLLIFVFPVGVFVFAWWGFKLGRRAYRLLVEPELRERLIEREVRKQVHATLSQERQALEGRHARSMEELSASIAHEIRNPITAAKSLVQQMGEEPTARDNVEYARVALEELDRVERSVSHLLRFARDEEVGLTPLRMADVVDSALETFRDRAARRGIALERRFDSEGAMTGDPEKLRRIVINLVGNAMDALDESGTPDPRVDVELGENLAGSEVWLRVRDNGPGIESEALRKLFSPFYTSKANGTGLGLAICKKLVDAHGGTIEAQSQPGAGAEFLVTLPRRSPGAAAPQGAQP